MKTLKFVGTVLLSALISSVAAQASASAATAPKSANRPCGKKVIKPKPAKVRQCSSPAIVRTIVQQPSRLDPLPPIRRYRCLKNNDRMVSFRLRNDRLRNENRRRYSFQYVAEDAVFLYYCVGSEEWSRNQYLDDLADVNISRRRYDSGDVIIASLSQPGEDENSPAPSRQCQLATTAVHVTPNTKPAASPLLAQVKNENEKIILLVTFNEDATIGPIRVDQSPSENHSRLAREAAQKIKFNPAWGSDGPVCVIQKVEYGYLSQPNIPKPSSAYVTLLSPTVDHIFSNSSRRIRFDWTPANNVSYYLLEVQYGSIASTDWYPFRRIIETQTNHELTFEGPYPGRWRVTPILLNKTEGSPTPWRYFGYKK